MIEFEIAKVYPPVNALGRPWQFMLKVTGEKGTVLKFSTQDSLVEYLSLRLDRAFIHERLRFVGPNGGSMLQ